MKIQELIAPGSRKPLPKTAGIDAIWDRLLSKRCTEIIETYRQTNDFLYRGMKTAIPWFRGASHEARQPKDSDPEISRRFDQMLAGCGMRALRRNSIFASSNRTHAEEFGPPYVIFPVDGFNFTYTTEDDLVLEGWSQVIDPETMRELNAAYIAAYRARHGDDARLRLFGNWINPSAVGKRSSPEEALVRLKELSDDPRIQALGVEDLFNVEVFRSRYQPRDHDLSEAIADHKEVMISGQYYAFKADLYEAQLIKRMSR